MDININANPKSILNEFCQKMCVSSPIYECEKVGGLSHNPLFISDVKFLFDNQIVTFRGNEESSRKKSEFSVAQIAINTLRIEELLTSIANTQKHELLLGIGNVNQQQFAADIIFTYKEHQNIFITVICDEQFKIVDETGITLKIVKHHENSNYVKNMMILLASRSTEQNIIMYGGGNTTGWEIDTFCESINREDNKPDRIIYFNNDEFLHNYLSII